jgi:hypothetical protein
MFQIKKENGQMKRLPFLVIVILLMFASCAYGIFLHRNRLPPYYLAKAILKAKVSRETENLVFNTIPLSYFETNSEELILIRTADDVLKTRTALVDFIWGDSGITTGLPSQIDANFKDERYGDLDSLEKIDRLVIEMEFGLKSYVYHFVPKKSNNKIILFHQGHKGDFIRNKELIAKLLDKGYSVAAFCMPLLGLNNQPSVFLPRFGYLKLTSHDHMKFLNPRQGHAIKYFIEPVIIVLNYIKTNYDYSHISMVGISGGAWTATLASAIDIRIQTSFPVAGSYPIFLRSESHNERDWGDWEQLVPELYRIANYLEMYILGACGDGRKQLQIINKYDSCCFAGIKWQLYKDVVSNRVKACGLGNWDLFLDDSHLEHRISESALSKILDEIPN